MYIIICVIVWFVSFAMTVREGLWNNAINYMCIVFASLISFGYFQSITRFLDEQLGGQYTYLLDFIIFWILFALSVGLLKVICKFLSPKRVLFHDKIESWFGKIFALTNASMMVFIVTASLHMAPLSYELCNGAYVVGDTYEEVETNLADAPGARLLELVEYMLTDNATGRSGFTAAGYVHTYGQHRKSFENTAGYLVDRR